MRKLILVLLMMKLLFLTWDVGLTRTVQLFSDTYSILFLSEPEVAALQGPKGGLQK